MLAQEAQQNREAELASQISKMQEKLQSVEADHRRDRIGHLLIGLDGHGEDVERERHRRQADRGLYISKPSFLNNSQGSQYAYPEMLGILSENLALWQTRLQLQLETSAVA